MFTKDGALHRFHTTYFGTKSFDPNICSARFAGFKEPERERIAKHFTNNFNLDMLDRLVDQWASNTSPLNILSLVGGRKTKLHLNVIVHCTGNSL